MYALLLWAKRSKMKKLAAGMEKRKVGDTVIYVTKLPVTPSAIGLLRTKIVMPEIRKFKASVKGWKRLSAISRNPVRPAFEEFLRDSNAKEDWMLTLIKMI